MRKKPSGREATPTHLALYMEGSVPNGERDAMQEGFGLLPQRCLLLQVIVHRVLARVAAAAAIRSQPSARQRATTVRVCHGCTILYLHYYVKLDRWPEW